MRHMIAAAALVLGACGQADETADGALGAGPAGACAGTRLPITRACGDANPALFRAVDSSLDTVARGCVWRTEELQIKENEVLLFRAQDCTGEMWDRTIYSYVGGYVKAKLAPVPDDQAAFVLQVFDVSSGDTAEQIALRTLSAAPEGQRQRCITSPLNNVRAPGQVFELAPNAELEAEMQASSPDEPWEACGPNGVTMDGIQYWEARDRHAMFHMVGQDQPLWDPASFTFYVKDDGARWAKAD
jgi:hypothetical protein